MYKTIKRNWLMKQVEDGKMEVKCRYHLTDDYAFDNANDFGKTEWKPARIRHPRFETITLQNGNEIQTCVDSDCKDGYLNMMTCDFEGKAGAAYKQDDGEEITLRVYSGLVYTLRMKK